MLRPQQGGVKPQKPQSKKKVYKLTSAISKKKQEKPLIKKKE